MGAASGGQPACGIIIGPLAESYPDRTSEGACCSFGPCLHAVGTSVGVRYTGIVGRREVDGIALDRLRLGR